MRTSPHNHINQLFTTLVLAFDMLCTCTLYFIVILYYTVLYEGVDGGTTLFQESIIYYLRGPLAENTFFK